MKTSSLFFIAILQIIICHEIADQILYELYPDILRTMGSTRIRDDIIVKNIEFVIPDIPFYKIEFFFDGQGKIKFSISDIFCYANIDVYPNPRDKTLHEHYKVEYKNFHFRGDLEFVRDKSFQDRYVPYYTNGAPISIDCDPIIDENILFVEYVEEYLYEIRYQAFRYWSDYWQGLINEIIQRLYIRGYLK